ncbi:MAG: metallopeptidase family protein, partial [Candidatus Binatia bacterium]
MNRRRFRRLVAEALDRLPPELAERVRNVEMVIEEEPSVEQLEAEGLDPAEETLYGLYEGVPLPEREHNFGMLLPDRITIFSRPLIEDFETADEIREQIRITVIHEIAHFFGMEDDDIEDLGY